MLPTPGKDTAMAALSTIANLGESERYWRMNAAEALWDGLDAQPRPSFWDKSVPLQERAPVVRSMLARAAGRRLASMVFGERAFPAVKVREKSYASALSESDREALTALLDEITDRTSLRVVMHQLLHQGLRSGSACALLCLRDGMPCVNLLPAKWCTPDLAPDGSVRSLVIEWQTMAVEGKETVQYKHRREITATEDRTYATVKNDGKPIDWSCVEVAEKFPLEFCPVVWVRNMADPTDGDVDGHPLTHGLEDEIGALDLSLSQGHRNSLYNGEPQTVRIGVVGNEGAQQMAPQGRTVNPEAASFSWLNSPRSAWEKMAGWATGGAPAAKKAPGTIWDLPAGGDSKLLESSGAGMVIIGQNIDRLRRVILDAIGVVLADPQTLGSGEISARALTLMHAPMLDVCDNLREEYGVALVRILDGLCRLCTTAKAKTDGVLLASLPAALPVLERQRRARTDASMAWLPLSLSLAWGAYFEPSWADVTAGVAAARSGVEGGVLSREQAVRMTVSLTGVDDADAEIERITGDQTAGRDAVASVVGALDPQPVTDTATPEITPADTAMNGAQTTSLIDIIKAVAAREIPRASGVQAIVAAFSKSEAQAEKILADAGTDAFKPAAAVPTAIRPAFGAPAAPPAAPPAPPSQPPTSEPAP